MSTFTDSGHAQSLGTLVPYDANDVTNIGLRGNYINPQVPPAHELIAPANPTPYGTVNNLVNQGWIMSNTGVIFEADFNSPEAITSLRAYSTYTGSVGQMNGGRGGDWLIEHSDNGMNWSTTHGGTFNFVTTFEGGTKDDGVTPETGGGGYGGWYPFSFNASEAPYRYWRINQTNGNTLGGHPPRVGEVEFYSTANFVPPTLLEWNINDTGNWNNLNNWQPFGGPPSTTKQTARFGSNANILGPTTAVTNSAVTINRVEFENATHSYAVAGLGSINLQESTVESTLPSIGVLAGTHEFQIRVNLGSDTLIDTAADTSLQFNHQLKLGGNTITKTGLGTVTINNNLVTGSGTLVCQEGVCGGNGTINGNLMNPEGTVSPGPPSHVSGVAGVPEPASALLISIGFALLAIYRRKRR